MLNRNQEQDKIFDHGDHGFACGEKRRREAASLFLRRVLRDRRGEHVLILL